MDILKLIPVRRAQLIRLDIVPNRTVATGFGLDDKGGELSFSLSRELAIQFLNAVRVGKVVEVTLRGRELLTWQFGIATQTTETLPALTQAKPQEV